MENQQLVKTLQFERGNRSYTVEVYKGMSFKKGQCEFNYKTHEAVVKIKLFSIMVRETTTDVYGIQSFVTESFMDCTARAGEFVYALDIMKNDCNDLNDIRFLMAEMEEHFSVAIHKDASQAVRKTLGLYNRKPAYDFTERTNVVKRLPNPFLSK